MKQSILFLVTTVVLYMSAIYLLGHVNLKGEALVFRTGDYYTRPGGATWESYREFDQDKHWDVALMGSSHTYRGYDPFVFTGRGHSCYNLGSSGQTPMNSYYIIKDLLDSTNTGLMVLDVYAGTFIGAGLESTSDLIRNYPHFGPVLGMAWSLRDLRGVNLIAFRATTPHIPPAYLNPDYMGLGFTPKLDSVGVPLPTDARTSLTLDKRQVYFFGEIVKLCTQRGIPLVVSSHYGRKGGSTARHAVFKACIDSVLADTGIPYLDYTESPGVSDVDNFADGNHLNLSGARIFTGHLVDSLESLGYLPRR